ncbi:RagB/SusD family nutrient uptake outer membrane protein [Flavivirga aquimarina]|uniref:RagB/SusD family nutrient uptake outer membrane protein n=1 Tax=Flavivirga aquimarina TaxID=2027862 RepID=A0ABT8W6K9_9FLAO|nr:RagB/SusD family nutrient uptake outer membrane protein [Flavivirga aquimarina]MDO5968753.1 RagB/SusD family nutrient uptake outer membrane protein [Flavivirga aquimarina]
MKNLFYRILVFVLVISLGGCQDFLEEDARGLLTPSSFFQNEDEANLALNGLIATMRDNDVSGQGMIRQQTMGTDVCVSGRFALAGAWLHSLYNLQVDNGAIFNIWADLYSGVKDANFIIASVENSSLSDEIKGATIAQAQFYRAYFYYRLTTMFGDVPFWLDELNIEEVSLLGSTPVAEIQERMILDLDQAINAGFLATSTWGDNGGRPTVWAARMMKAHLHMWQQQWPEARTELSTLINNSPHGTTLMPYGDIYRGGNELNSEIIFGVEYLTGVIGNTMNNQTHFNAAGETAEAIAAHNELGIFARAAAITWRRSFANSYADEDARKPYNVFDRFTFPSTGEEVFFNNAYVPKFMRDVVPVSDPLMIVPDANGQGGATINLMTLSEAYLLLAECEFEIGGSSGVALEAINVVRRRANLTDLTALTIEDIRQERAWELAGEGMGRKNDLIRWGILEETVQGIAAAETAAGAIQLAIDRAVDEAANIAAGPAGRFNFLPIPLVDILNSQQIGGALEQNPLWE